MRIPPLIALIHHDGGISHLAFLFSAAARDSTHDEEKEGVDVKERGEDETQRGEEETAAVVLCSHLLPFPVILCSNGPDFLLGLFFPFLSIA